MNFIVALIIETTIITAEKEHCWREGYSRNDFIDLVEEAMRSGIIEGEDAFRYIMRAMVI